MLEINLTETLYLEAINSIDDMIDKLYIDAQTTQDTAYINGMARAKGILMQVYNTIQSTDE